MARKSWGINFDGFLNLSERYLKIGGDLKKVVNECLIFIPGKINPKLEKAMNPHKRTGKTGESLAKDQRPEWTGDRAQIKVGYKISEGGLPSIFLMYGTARHTPVNKYGTPKKAGARENPGIEADKKLYNAIYGTAVQKEIANEQENIFVKALKKRLNA